jgi:Cellulose synthase
MYSTDPTSPQRALCYFLDPVASDKLAYVQFPQRFQGLNKSDIYGGELKHLYKINPYGMDGFGGPNYLGSNTFLARKALFDSSVEGANGHDLIKPEMVLEMASEVAACNYEIGTKWGEAVLPFSPNPLLFLYELFLELCLPDVLKLCIYVSGFCLVEFEHNCAFPITFCPPPPPHFRRS